MNNLDKIDKHILRLLQHNAKISNLELAEQVGLSPTPCARRVKQLEEAGYIERTLTVLNQEKLGLNLTVYIAVSMKSHTPESFELFEKAVKELPEVVGCSVVTSRAEDFLLRVVVRDMQHYQEFLLSRLNRIEGVDNMYSSFVLRDVIHFGELPIA